MSIVIDEKTPVIVQGITGRMASFHTLEMVEYGTNVVGGVSPGKGGDLTPVVKIGDTVTKGSYLGHFGYGGSSIVLAFQPEVNGKSLSYNFAAGAPSGSAPLPIGFSDAPIQVKALQQIGVAKLE